jgi:hypothetical protein
VYSACLKTRRLGKGETMRYLTALFLIVALSGCDRDENPNENGTTSGAADSGAAQSVAPPASETLNVTYSKVDPYQSSQPAKKDTSPGTAAPDHAGHDMKKMADPEKKEKPAQENKPEHEEHPKK